MGGTDRQVSGKSREESRDTPPLLAEVSRHPGPFVVESQRRQEAPLESRLGSSPTSVSRDLRSRWISMSLSPTSPLVCLRRPNSPVTFTVPPGFLPHPLGSSPTPQVSSTLQGSSPTHWCPPTLQRSSPTLLGSSPTPLALGSSPTHWCPPLYRGPPPLYWGPPPLS